MRPPNIPFTPGALPRSTRRVEKPLRARVNAAAEPAGPAPTTMTSKRSTLSRSHCGKAGRVKGFPKPVSARPYVPESTPTRPCQSIPLPNTAKVGPVPLLSLVACFGGHGRRLSRQPGPARPKNETHCPFRPHCWRIGRCCLPSHAVGTPFASWSGACVRPSGCGDSRCVDSNPHAVVPPERRAAACKDGGDGRGATTGLSRSSLHQAAGGSRCRAHHRDRGRRLILVIHGVARVDCGRTGNHDPPRDSPGRIDNSPSGLSSKRGRLTELSPAGWPDEGLPPAHAIVIGAETPLVNAPRNFRPASELRSPARYRIPLADPPTVCSSCFWMLTMTSGRRMRHG